MTKCLPVLNEPPFCVSSSSCSLVSPNATHESFPVLLCPCLNACPLISHVLQWLPVSTRVPFLYPPVHLVSPNVAHTLTSASFQHFCPGFLPSSTLSLHFYELYCRHRTTCHLVILSVTTTSVVSVCICTQLFLSSQHCLIAFISLF